MPHGIRLSYANDVFKCQAFVGIFLGRYYFFFTCGRNVTPPVAGDLRSPVTSRTVHIITNNSPYYRSPEVHRITSPWSPISSQVAPTSYITDNSPHHQARGRRNITNNSPHRGRPQVVHTDAKKHKITKKILINRPAHSYILYTLRGVKK